MELAKETLDRLGGLTAVPDDFAMGFEIFALDRGISIGENRKL